ncbi:S41 family peptidase [bacterium]|nr:S41 family peptidase [candidate division CSSED10-310 bacterium]
MKRVNDINNLKVHRISWLMGTVSGIVVALAILMSFYAVKAFDSTKEADESLKLLAYSMDMIQSYSYKPIDEKDLVYSGIQGMLRTLDPYSQFLDEDTFRYMQEQQAGSFYGIGISFDIRNGQLIVVAPIEDSPSWKLGIKPGDVIVEIEGQSTAGITTSEVLNRLRGEKGSTVNIKIKRLGVSEPIPFTITRDKIALNSVRDGFLLEGDTGYVRITEFSSTTGESLNNMLDDLKKKHMKRLILDLRFNGGGLLSAAEEVSALFLHKGDLIVSTRGRRPESKMEIKTKKEGPYSDLPIIIIVNEGSASSSEIVAGAIQDHDRGLIVGTPTHGKGLVGSQYTTKLSTAVQITTAQYFTPSGRFIQKPYNIPHRSSESVKSSLMTEHTDVPFLTDSGREVLSEGGITPDVIVEEPVISENLLRLESMSKFFDFAVNEGNKYKPITEDFVVTTEIYNQFIEYLKKSEIDIDFETLEQDKEYIENAIKRELFSVYISSEAGEKIKVNHLQTVQRSLELFDSMNTYLKPSELAKHGESDKS